MDGLCKELGAPESRGAVQLLIIIIVIIKNEILCVVHCSVIKCVYYFKHYIIIAATYH